MAGNTYAGNDQRTDAVAMPAARALPVARERSPSSKPMRPKRYGVKGGKSFGIVNAGIA